ncbi:MAG: long-chain fatty acid--CoA ligase [Polaromonas sp.]|nr:long-chain fatty acid--CoA ligase [Polaromonas sp.]
MQLHLLLEMAAEAAPERIAIGAQAGGSARALSMGELLDAARRAAAWMNTDHPGRAVVYTGLNGPGFAIALFAASMAGRPFTPLNYRLPDADLRRLLERSAPALALCDADTTARLGGVAGTEVVAIENFIAASCAGPVPPAPPETEQDIAVVLFTSGTTSEPKAAILRHRHLTSYVLSTLEFLGAQEHEATLVSVPPYHIAGISAVLTSVFSGRRMVQLPAFTPEVWLETVIAEKVSHAMVVPTMLGRILDLQQQRGTPLTSLRALSYGGGRMPVSVIERAMDLLPAVDFVNAYGLTETSSTIAILDPESHRAARAATDPAVRRRLGSVGQPLPALELEIRDEADLPVPAGQVGQIWVRGDQVSGEYAGRKAIQDDGWFPTQDAGWLDDAGYLYVEGRLDDVIVRGGENISPSEIEDALREHPAVRDVAVLGLPDDEWGEAIAAVVVASSGVSADELKALVKARLRSTRVPQDIVFRDALPYNETGKLLRRVLKSELTLARQQAAHGPAESSRGSDASEPNRAQAAHH